MFAEQFEHVDSFLFNLRDYWQFSPFAQHSSPWDNPALTELLASLDEAGLAKLEQDQPHAKQQLASYLPELESLKLADYPLARRETLDTPFWLTNGVKGRKIKQIQAFSETLQPTHLPLMEWCAGKGHLGRVASFHHQQPVLSLEWQQQLCEQGQAQAKQQQIEQQFVHCDVLQDDTSEHFQPEQHVMALHACGQLHVELMQQASRTGTQALSICPCCYHLQPHAEYQALSEQAQASPLRLSKQQLQLAVQQTVTGGARVTRLRHTEQTWRLGYDALRQSELGQSDYRPLKSCPKTWFNQGEQGFASFCAWAAEQHQWSLPEQLDCSHWLNIGEQRYRKVREWEVVRHLFQQALEHWLVLDRALYLEQQGYRVELVKLFDFQLSPRNLLIRAQK